jgi:hypothetical protein
MPIAANLHIDPIQAATRSHHGRDSECGFRPRNGNLRLSAVFEGSRHRGDALFQKAEMCDAPAGAFQFMIHRQFDAMEFEPIDGFLVEALEDEVFKAVAVHGSFVLQMSDKTLGTNYIYKQPFGLCGYERNNTPLCWVSNIPLKNKG